MLLHCYVTKAVERNDTRPSTGVEQQELPENYFKIPYIGYFSGVAQRKVRKIIILLLSYRVISARAQACVEHMYLGKM